jgi:thiol-disulfide isomerase/thioredoxin
MKLGVKIGLALGALLIVSAFFMHRSEKRIAPEFVGIETWLNSPPLTMESLRGKVVLVDFWTYSCVNCLRTLPYLKSWDEKYRDKGLVIIGVHSPEFQFERDQSNVRMAISKYGLKYPNALDNSFQTWTAFQNHFWPHKYLIDQDGVIRHEQIGESGHQETESMIQKLLAERGRGAGMPAQMPSIITIPETEIEPRKIGTPEIFLGLEKSEHQGNEESAGLSKTINYKQPEAIRENRYYLVGSWTVEQENAKFMGGAGGGLLLRYTARSMNMVAGAVGDQPVVIELELDGKPLTEKEAGSDVKIDSEGRATAQIRESRLYNLIHNQAGYGTHTLTIKIQNAAAEKEAGSLRVFTFTFG